MSLLLTFGLGPSGGGVTPPQSGSDLLSALVTYLGSSATLATAMGGAVRVYSTVPIDAPGLPFLLIEGYEEILSGATLNDEPIDLAVSIYAASEAAAKDLAPALHIVLDSPAVNPDSIRTGRLSWSNGQETACWRNATGKPKRIKGFWQGGGYVWYCPTAYQFWVDEIQ